jgi:hypothetical protein
VINTVVLLVVFVAAVFVAAMPALFHPVGLMLSADTHPMGCLAILYWLQAMLKGFYS